MKRCFFFVFSCLFVFSCSIISGPINDKGFPNSDIKAVNFNYADAFAKSIMFYEANWCGPNAGNNRLAWRGPCHTNDGKDVGLDLTGGFHDCGDHVKFGLPQVYAASTLAWAYYEFKDVFVAKGQDTYMLNILKNFTDYFLRSFPNKTTFHYQVGDGTIDHTYWGPPELQTDQISARPTLYSATPTKPASDVCGTASATLALMYLNYRDRDSAYATRCLNAAKDLYTFAKTYRGLSESGGFYGSTGYWDDLCWGAIWLYVATGDGSYMSDVNTWLSNKGINDTNPYNNHWTHCWDDVWGGVFVKLAQLTNRAMFKFVAEENLSYWISNITRTKGGLCFLNSWGNARYVAAECMLAVVYHKTTSNQVYLDFAKSQIDYILGNNPKNYSYVVGFGANYPKYPHHRAASGRFEYQPANESKKDPQRHLLYGALVGGPDLNDNYTDDIEDYATSEVGIDYNAGLVGALAGIVKAYGMNQNPEPTPGIEPTNSAYYVSAYLVNENNQQSTIRAYIHNDSLLPPHYEKNLSFRYFIDLSEYSNNTSGITVAAYYNPSKAVFSQLTRLTGNIYYVEVTFTNEFYGKVPFEFCIANYNSSSWNPTNDYSRDGLPRGTNDILTEKIPVYRNGTLIFGKEPVASSSSSSSSLSSSSSVVSSSSSVSSRSSSSVSSSSISSSSSMVSSSVSSSSSVVSSSSSSVTSSSSSTGVTYVTITLPFSYDGAGEFYWKTDKFSTVVNWSRFVNSWNVDILEINGVNYANKWVAEHTIPPASDGFWYIRYKASVNWAHFEAK